VSDDLHLIQYRDPDGWHCTAILCRAHRQGVFAVLRSEGIGALATRAPSLARCDGCENAERKAAS
jgi:hypothetical protein